MRNHKLQIWGRKLGHKHPRDCVFLTQEIKTETLTEAREEAEKLLAGINEENTRTGLTNFDMIIPFIQKAKWKGWTVPANLRDAKGRPFKSITRSTKKPIGPKWTQLGKMNLHLTLTWYKNHPKG